VGVAGSLPVVGVVVTVVVVVFRLGGETGCGKSGSSVDRAGSTSNVSSEDETVESVLRRVRERFSFPGERVWSTKHKQAHLVKDVESSSMLETILCILCSSFSVRVSFSSRSDIRFAVKASTSKDPDPFES